jgi:hypothetical protein
MDTMKLYRLLQQHVGDLNALVIALYNGEISPEEAKAKAKEKTEQTLSALAE